MRFIHKCWSWTLLSVHSFTSTYTRVPMHLARTVVSRAGTCGGRVSAVGQTRLHVALQQTNTESAELVTFFQNYPRTYLSYLSNVTYSTSPRQTANVCFLWAQCCQLASLVLNKDVHIKSSASFVSRQHHKRSVSRLNEGVSPAYAFNRLVINRWSLISLC